MIRRSIPWVVGLLLGGSLAAFGANTTFFTGIGDVVFPFSPPAASGAAGAIDNMVIGATTPRAGTFTALTAPSQTGTNATAGNTAGGPIGVTGGSGFGTGAGGAASVTGGASGAGLTGNGGAANLTGGAAASSNGNGGSAIITGGAKTGTGVAGSVIERGVRLVSQGAPAAKTVSATLTAAEVLTGIITVNQGAAGASAQQLPLATDMDAAIPDAAAGDAFDFSVINISTVAAEAASITTNTGWTLVGDMDVAANNAITTKSAGRLRARKTGTGAWVLYRLS